MNHNIQMPPCRVVEMLRDVFEILGTVDEKAFDICAWVGIYRGERIHTCKTVACAIGHCLLRPDFRDKYRLELTEGTISPTWLKYAPKAGGDLAGFPAIRYALGLPNPSDLSIVGGLEAYVFSAHMYKSSSRASVEDVRERIQEVLGWITNKVKVTRQDLGFDKPSAWGNQCVADIHYAQEN